MRAARKSFWFGKNTVLFAKNTVKTGAAVTKTGYRIGKLAGKNAIKSAKFIKTHGVKGTAKIGVKNAKYGVRNKVKKTFKMLKTFSYKGFVKNKGMSFLNTIARVLQVLVTSLLSILLPIVVAVILILVMIFSFLAFIKNSGEYKKWLMSLHYAMQHSEVLFPISSAVAPAVEAHQEPMK